MKNNRLIKNIILIIVAVITVISLLFAVPIKSRADFGDFGGDDDYGYDYDYDDYDYDYGDDDYDNDYDDDDYDYDDDDDYYYYGGDSYSSGGGSSSDSAAGYQSGQSNTWDNITGAFYMLVFYGGAGFLIVLFIVKKLRRRRRNNSRPNVNAGAAPTSSSSLHTIASYLNEDPAFDQAAFEEKLSNLYVQMQNCWTAKDIEPLRNDFTDAYYTQMDRQLDHYRQNGQTNVVENIAVLDVRLLGWRREGGEDHIIAAIKTRITDYVINDANGDIVKGSMTAEKFMTYEWDLCRTTGKVTGKSEGVSRVVCPSCGAPVDINVSARCEYCGTVLRSDDFDWAICRIRGISQRTNV